MTIGIGAVGKNAGLAVWKALQAVEAVTTGSVGGFAAFAIMDKDNKVKYYCTQRGGSSTLFTYGDSVMKYPPQEVIEARIAGVTSSGPDRQTPLTLNTPAEDGVGIVAGHRVPYQTGKNGMYVNSEVLQLMKNGMHPQDAVDQVLGRDNPNIDAGLIAIDIHGNIGMRNSERVKNRPDVTVAELVEGDTKITVINNEIYPYTIVADLAAAVGMEVMLEDREPDLVITLRAGTKIQYAEEDRIVINDDNEAIEIYTNDETLLARENTPGVVPYINTPVIRNGEVIGKMMNESVGIFDYGVINNFMGLKEVQRDVRLF